MTSTTPMLATEILASVIPNLMLILTGATLISIWNTKRKECNMGYCRMKNHIIFVIGILMLFLGVLI